MTSPAAQRRGRAGWLAMPLRSDQVPAGATYLAKGDGLTIPAGGLPVTVKISPEACEGQLMLHEQIVPPQMLVPAHWHDRAAQFAIVTEGTLRCLVGATVHTLREGDFLWRPPGIVHAVWNPDPDQPARQIEGSMPGADMLGFFTAFGELTRSGELTAARLAEIAAPFGTFYDDALTRQIENRHQVSASGGWRL